VRHRGCSEAAAFDGDFDRCCEVNTLRELAEFLDREGLLHDFLEQLRLNSADTEVVGARLRRLKDAEHQYAEALDLTRRIQASGFEPDVSARRHRELRSTIIDLYRHLGYYGTAEEMARDEVRQCRAWALSSHDDEARAYVNLAAALFDPHRFAEIEEILGPWCERLRADPRLVSASTRVMVFNTCARAQAISGADGWEASFRRSEEILRHWEPSDLPRTWSYLAHGLLRHGRLEEAEEVIRQIERHPGLDARSRWSVGFLQAEAARQRGTVWASDEMEVNPQEWPGVGHPFGFYLQATARQSGRDREDSVERFRRAVTFFARDVQDDGSPNIQRFLTDCMRLGDAAWAGDTSLWNQAREAIADRLRPCSGLRLDEHYAGVFDALGASPDRVAADSFLSRVPFF
jgi:pentatricopeptide repeat protein